MADSRKLKISDVKDPWHVVRTLKDMPGTTREILFKSDTGYNYIGWWDAHKRQLFVQAIRNHWDSVMSDRVLDGKVDSYRVKFKSDDRGMCVAWCDIPQDNSDWKDWENS